MNETDFGLCRIYWRYPQKIPERGGGYQIVYPQEREVNSEDTKQRDNSKTPSSTKKPKEK